jgi:pyruvate carboxylase
VLWVEPPTGTGPFTPDVTNRMRFFRADETTGVALISGPGPVGKEVAYWVDHTNHELRRLDPDHPWGYRVMVRELDSFTVDVVDPNVTLTMKVRGNHQSLQITARAPRM